MEYATSIALSRISALSLISLHKESFGFFGLKAMFRGNSTLKPEAVDRVTSKKLSYSLRTKVAGYFLSSSVQLLSFIRLWIISSTSPSRASNTSARISLAACSFMALLLLLTLARLDSTGLGGLLGGVASP